MNQKNIETAMCIICGKEYIKRKFTKKNYVGSRQIPIRGANTKTCSRKCSSKVR